MTQQRQRFYQEIVQLAENKSLSKNTVFTEDDEAALIKELKMDKASSSSHCTARDRSEHLTKCFVILDVTYRQPATISRLKLDISCMFVLFMCPYSDAECTTESYRTKTITKIYL